LAASLGRRGGGGTHWPRGASAAVYASAAKPYPAASSLTPSPSAAPRASGPPNNQIAKQKAAQAAARAQASARDRARRALERARAASAQRAAREHARQSILARARSNPQAVARLLATDKGWGGAQFGCLDRLWTKESSWRWNADNPTSDAYGIPQSLPGEKMASAGSDWVTNPVTQIKWGLTYIAHRYGTPCSAWSFHQSANWY
jgi:hypothetical protein